MLGMNSPVPSLSCKSGEHSHGRGAPRVVSPLYRSYHAVRRACRCMHLIHCRSRDFKFHEKRGLQVSVKILDVQRSQTPACTGPPGRRVRRARSVDRRAVSFTGTGRPLISSMTLIKSVEGKRTMIWRDEVSRGTSRRN